jgi:hypothetical protein
MLTEPPTGTPRDERGSRSMMRGRTKETIMSETPLGRFCMDPQGAAFAVHASAQA